MNILKPHVLSPGARIGIISPASPQRDPERLQRGIAYLESKGYEVKLATNALATHAGYLAGTDQQRIDDIEAMFADDTIDAIMCARGGYGTTRILGQLNYDIIGANPKPFIGFSDTTALQTAIFARTGLITFSGAMPSVDFADDIDSFTEGSFWSMLTHDVKNTFIHADSPTVYQEGTAEGRLICGNLCLLATLCGSSYTSIFNDAILMIEDIGEEPYRIDRYLSQLELSGALHSVNGVLIGDFTPPKQPSASVPQRSYQEIISDYASRVQCPVLGTFAYGHIKRKLTLPFGIHVLMNTTDGTVMFGESQCS